MYQQVGKIQGTWACVSCVLSQSQEQDAEVMLCLLAVDVNIYRFGGEPMVSFLVSGSILCIEGLRWLLAVARNYRYSGLFIKIKLKTQ